jgi:tetratricopeptide (TPR) repeat protein
MSRPELWSATCTAQDMKSTVVALLISLFLQPLYAGGPAKKGHTLTGAVVTPEGTMVSKFTVILRPRSDKPQLIKRFHFKDGLFELKDLPRGQYKVQVVAPAYAGVTMDLQILASDNESYRTVVLHPARIETKTLAGPEFSLKRVGIPPLAEEAYRRGVQMHRSGAFDEAMMAYGEAIRLHPDYVDALSDIGALYILLNRPESAMTFLRRALRIDPTNVVVRANLAASLVNQRNFGEGIRMYQQILDEYSGSNLVRYQIAKAYWSQGKYDSAEKIIREALTEDPGRIDGWVLLLNVATDQGNEQTVIDTLITLREKLDNPGFSRFVELQMIEMAATN